MATFNKINVFTQELGLGTHVFGTDVLKLGLTNTDPTAAGTVLTAGLSTANGYTAPGPTITGVTWTTSGGVAKLVIADVVVTAAGGPIGPFQWAVIHNSSKSNKIVGYYNYGSSITLLDTETFTVDADPTNGILTVT
jgi:hypothetical protein